MPNQTSYQTDDPKVPTKGTAANPFHDGFTGRASVFLTFALVGLFALFLLLDTIQFTLTGHESSTFTAITRGVGGLGLGSLLITLGKSYFTKRVQ